DLLPPPAGPGRDRADQHGLVPGDPGGGCPRLDLVGGLATLVGLAVRGLRRRPGTPGRDRPTARPPPPDRGRVGGEGAGCLPYQAGSPASLEDALEASGTAVGAGRASRPTRGLSAAAGPRQSGPGPESRSGLAEGGSGVPAVRGGQGGLDARRAGAEPV